MRIKDVEVKDFRLSKYLNYKKLVSLKEKLNESFLYYFFTNGAQIDSSLGIGTNMFL